MKMIILLNRYLGIPLESLIVGNKSVKLKPYEKKMVLSLPSIGEYLKNSYGTEAVI